MVPPEPTDPGAPGRTRRSSDPGRGVYGISVVSDLLGTRVQNLRAYERAGLVHPDRTAGGTRLYSPDDVARLRRVQRLLADGLNLTGIGRVLELEDDLAEPARSWSTPRGRASRPASGAHRLQPLPHRRPGRRRGRPAGRTTAARRRR